CYTVKAGSAQLRDRAVYARLMLQQALVDHEHSPGLAAIIAEVAHRSRHSFHIVIDRFVARVGSQYSVLARSLNNGIGGALSRYVPPLMLAPRGIGQGETPCPASLPPRCG